MNRKTINRERILRALNKILIYFRNNPEFKIFNNLNRNGIKFKGDKIIDSNDNPLTDKERLELSYQGFYDNEKISKCVSRCKLEGRERLQDIWFHSWYWLVNQKLKREQKIIAIQRKYQISGLQTKRINIDNKVFEVYKTHYKLDLIEQDYETLKESRKKILEVFLSIFQTHKMKLYRNVTGLDGKRGWIETKPEVISNIVDNYIWADIWEKKYYLNYEELYSNGHTTPKQIPESELDEFVWDLYLLTGNGTPDEIEDCCCFCARIGRELPSI